MKSAKMWTVHYNLQSDIFYKHCSEPHGHLSCAADFQSASSTDFFLCCGLPVCIFDGLFLCCGLPVCIF
ncbi:hypothetical protein KKB99_07665, partial [bacterium]|nr:hypothetical protein [bacterium]MBU1025869.1 hypothetical protein [bacterium]